MQSEASHEYRIFTLSLNPLHEALVIVPCVLDLRSAAVSASPSLSISVMSLIVKNPSVSDPSGPSISKALSPAVAPEVMTKAFEIVPA